MYDLKKAYPKKFFKQRASLNWRVPIFCNAILDVISPSSIIDLGCGNGDLLKGFQDRGIKTLGVEGTGNCADFLSLNGVLIFDLRGPGLRPVIEHVLLFPNSLDISKGHFDLALCLEVAEHIEPEYEDVLLENIIEVADKVIFSAAKKGQGGRCHYNCQDKAYWIEAFYRKGMNYRIDLTERVLTGLFKYRNKKGIKAYYQNLLVFEKDIIINE